MKTTISAWAFVISNFIACSIHAQQGTLDSTFNGTGIQIQAPSLLNDIGQAVVVQPDSSIVFGGISTTLPATGFDVCVGRMHYDGSIDSTFGTNGYVIYDYKTKTDYCYDLVLQPDGKIIVIGAVTLPPANTEILVMRLNTDGSYDSTFAGTGILVLPISLGEDYGRKGLIQPDGKILVCGYSIMSGSDQSTLIRLNSNGTLDNTFGSGGFVQTNFQFTELRPVNMLLRPNGNIVCVGFSTDVTLTQTGEAYGFKPNGSIDSVFGNNGVIALPGIYTANGVAENNNTIYVCGIGGTGNAPIGYIYALNDTGLYLPNFGIGGQVSVIQNMGVGYNAIAVQQDGRLIVGGGSLIAQFQSDFIISRFNTDGSIDSTFGMFGHFIADLGNNTTENLLDLALQPDGKIVGMGTKLMVSNDMAFVRLNATSSAAGIANYNDYTNAINVFPNPASDKIQLALPADVKVKSVEVITATGSVTSVKLDGNNAINVRDFSKGIYVLKVQTANAIYTSKFIVE